MQQLFYRNVRGAGRAVYRVRRGQSKPDWGGSALERHPEDALPGTQLQLSLFCVPVKFPTRNAIGSEMLLHVWLFNYSISDNINNNNIINNKLV